MKKVYILAAVLFLASCGNAEVQENKVDEAPATPETVVEQTVEVESEEDEKSSEDETDSDEQNEEVVKPEEDDREEESEVSAEINSEVDALETVEEDTSKTTTLDAAYTNPKGPVDMKVTYTTDADGIITALNVSATTYDVTDFNNQVQTLVGSTLEDAAEYKSGSSLTGYAFTQAIKEEIN